MMWSQDNIGGRVLRVSTKNGQHNDNAQRRFCNTHLEHFQQKLDVHALYAQRFADVCQQHDAQEEHEKRDENHRQKGKGQGVQDGHGGHGGGGGYDHGRTCTGTDGPGDREEIR